jgi:succinate dehydrogenase / fumarate reductase, cytochrome b subunit
MVSSVFFRSSLVKKFWMGITGLFLVSFLLVHCIVNAAIFFDVIDPSDNGQTFNAWAHFMGTNLIIRTMEIVLFAGFILHIVDGLVLYFQNRKARPVKYAYEKAGTSSTWYSRSMALLGTLILLFLVLHMYHFWLKTRITHLTIPVDTMYVDGKPYENLFGEMQFVFQHEWVVIVYVLGCFSLFWHLLHGFKSAFQSMGWNHHKYNHIIALSGDAFSIIVPIIFALMPIAMYFGWVAQPM